MSQSIIPHSRPTLGKEEIDAVVKTMEAGSISQGDKVKEFEESMASFVDVKGAVATNSGTSALHLGMVAMGIGNGDDVIIPSNVCTAPLNSAYMTGARPQICDIEKESFNISFETAEDVKTKDTKAVIVPHMFGNVVDLEKIENTGVPVIEDCAHAIGASYGSVKAGKAGRFSIVSMYTNKILCCGEGGMLLSDDEDIIAFARDRRDYDSKDNYKLRYNYKMTDIQAAMGLVQLKKLPDFIERRKNIAKKYDEAFKELDIVVPTYEFEHIYYRYVIRIKSDISKAISSMHEDGVISTRPVFKPLHRYLEIRSGFGCSDEVYSSALSIPIYPSLSDDEQEKVIAAVRKLV